MAQDQGAEGEHKFGKNGVEEQTESTTVRKSADEVVHGAGARKA